MKKNNPTKKIFLLTLLCSSLTACGFFDTDNTPTPTPLTSFKSEIKVKSLWHTNTGFGVDTDYLKLAPAVTDKAVFVGNKDGSVVATDKTSGSNLWRAYTKLNLSAGATTDNGLVFFGSRKGDVIALNQTDGKTVWKTQVSTEVLAAPTASNNVVVVKAIDGKVTGLSEQDGHVLWSFQQTEPTLILRGGSAPQISQNQTVIGFANGNLAKLNLHNGNLAWLETIAQPQGIFTIQRMVDIDADPVISRNRVYVATYQGKVAALDFASGKIDWSQDVSSYAGIAVDDSRLYLSDAKSDVTAYSKENGAILWRQKQLEARKISGPAVMGDYLVIGDELGYLHWLNKQDGHFAARIKIGGYGTLATPVVVDHVVYIITKDGRLEAYEIS